MTQMPLNFPDAKLARPSSLNKFEILFAQLPPIPETLRTEGRHPVPDAALLRALIYKNLRSLPDFSSLVRELRDSSALREVCGLHDSISVERFSVFLKKTPNTFFQNIREALIQELLNLNCIKGRSLALDSCPVYAPVRENNLKTIVKNRFEKTKILKGAPDARLGVTVTFPTPAQKKIAYFWGYRNFVTLDAESELPLGEITKPANIHEITLILPQLQYLQQRFNLNSIEAVLGDASFYSVTVIEFISRNLKALPIIARNPRRGKEMEYKISSKGNPLCVAGLEMTSWGKFLDKTKGYRRQKFICPIKASKKFARQVPCCPWNHPKFVNNRYGCIPFLRADTDESIRNSIPYGNSAFKKLYAKRISVERGFARLLAYCMQYPTVHGLQAVSNGCTIAHITALAVALTAFKTGHKDKLRFVKKFIPSL